VITPLLAVRDLALTYPARRGHPPVTALEGIDLAVAAGEVVALVGESGCGKSTLARVIVGLERPRAGEVALDGVVAVNADGVDRRRLSRAVQIVFQDPYLSLNPRLSVGRSIAEPLDAQGDLAGPRAQRDRERRRRVAELLDGVGLPGTDAARRPAELSGGARQRVAIARALALRPRLLVLDEPVSSLDASIAAQVMALLAELRARDGLAYLLISHDLATAGGAADRIAVMDGGRIVEDAPAARVLSAPRSARGRALLASAQALSLAPWAWPGSTVQA
jgi:ABC-type glutathione transport system ATPase component